MEVFVRREMEEKSSNSEKISEKKKSLGPFEPTCLGIVFAYERFKQYLINWPQAFWINIKVASTISSLPSLKNVF